MKRAPELDILQRFLVDECDTTRRGAALYAAALAALEEFLHGRPIPPEAEGIEPLVDLFRARDRCVAEFDVVNGDELIAGVRAAFEATAMRFEATAMKRIPLDSMDRPN